MNPMPSVNTPNTRSRRIAGILKRPPTRAARLALVSKTAQARVAEWELSSLRDPELASLEVEASIVDHAEELGYVVVEFSLVWETEEGRPITSPNISWRRPESAEPLESGHLDGSDRAERAQDQRHKEANMRVMLQTHMGQVRQLQEHNETLHGQLMRAYALVDELRDELAVTKEQLISREEVTVAPAEPSPVQQQFLTLAAQYLPVLVAQAMAAPKPAQPAPAEG